MPEEELKVRVTLDAKGFERELDRTEDKLKSFASTAESVGNRLTIGVTLPLLGAATAAVKYASDTTEALNKTRVVFGASSSQIEAWAQNSARAFAMSRAEAYSAVSTFGNLFVALQINERQAASMSMALTQLAADLASFNNVSIQEAFIALRAGLVGETEPLRRFGVNLSDATLRLEALRLGLTDTTKEVLEPATRAQAAYSLILQQTSKAQGDFARTSDELANASRSALAELKEVSAQFGEVLLPVAKDALAVFRELLQTFNGLPEANRKALIGFAALAAALGPVLRGAGALAGLLTQYRMLAALQGMSGVGAGAGGAALAGAGPIGLAVGAGIAGRAAMSLLPKPFDRSPFELLMGKTYLEMLGFGQKRAAAATQPAAAAAATGALAGMSAPAPGVTAGVDAGLRGRLSEALFGVGMTQAGLAAGDSARARAALQAPVISTRIAELMRQAEPLRAAVGSETEDAARYYQIVQEVLGLERDLQALQRDAADEARREYEEQARKAEEQHRAKWRLVDIVTGLARTEAQTNVLNRQLAGDLRTAAELNLEALAPVLRDYQAVLQRKAVEVRTQEEYLQVQQEYLSAERELVTLQADAQRARAEQQQRLADEQQRLADEQRKELERAHRSVLDRHREQQDLSSAVVALQEARLGNVIGITPQQRAAGILPALFQQLRYALRPVAGESQLETVRRMTGIEGIKSNILEAIGAKGSNSFVQTPFGMMPNFDVNALRQADIMVRGLEREAAMMQPVGAETLAAQAAAGAPVVFQVTVDAISPEQLRANFETMFRELTARVFGR